MEKVVVVGALSFLGSRLVSSLVTTAEHRPYDVIAVAQDGDIVAKEELLWYRRDQLLEHHRVSVTFANFSNSTQLQRSILGKEDKSVNPSSLVYFVPGIDDMDEIEYSGEGVNFNSVQSTYLSEFVTMLEMLRKTSPCTRVVLVTQSALRSCDSHVMASTDHMTIKQSWMRTYELMLSTYHNLYQLPITILRVGSSHGPWSQTTLQLQDYLDEQGYTPSTNEWSKLLPRLCWYVEDVVESIVKAIDLPTSEYQCSVLDIGGCTLSQNHTFSIESTIDEKLNSFSTALEHILTDEVQQSWEILNISSPLALGKASRRSLGWAKSFLSQRRGNKERNVVFTSYFTSTEDSQRHRRIKPDKFEYMKEWTLSLRNLRMEAVVFHDELDSRFQHRISQFYSNITFEYVPSLQHRSTNDARFYAYLKYLKHHPEIDRVLLTDISDVRFQFNPFELMSLLGNWLYIGTDIDIFPTMKTMQWIHERLRGCFGNYSIDEGDLKDLMELDTVYNAGTIGGSREMLLAALSRIVEYLNLTPTQLNCNMPAVNFAIHKHFYDTVFTGYPLSSRFLRRQASPKGVYIIHK